jgi:hypothetical protein
VQTPNNEDLQSVSAAARGIPAAKARIAASIAAATLDDLISESMLAGRSLLHRPKLP